LSILTTRINIRAYARTYPRFLLRRKTLVRLTKDVRNTSISLLALGVLNFGHQNPRIEASHLIVLPGKNGRVTQSRYEDTSQSALISEISPTLILELENNAPLYCSLGTTGTKKRSGSRDESWQDQRPPETRGYRARLAKAFSGASTTWCIGRDVARRTNLSTKASAYLYCNVKPHEII